MQFCYLIYTSSSNNSNRSRSYIGYTINPRRRLRQHNGDIKGGAKRTKNGINWRHCCIV